MLFQLLLKSIVHNGSGCVLIYSGWQKLRHSEWRQCRAAPL